MLEPLLQLLEQLLELTDIGDTRQKPAAKPTVAVCASGRVAGSGGMMQWWRIRLIWAAKGCNAALKDFAKKQYPNSTI